MAIELKNTPTFAEANVAAELQDKLKRRMRDSQRSEGPGQMGSVRASVLGLVVSEQYDRAISDLREYVEDRTSYPHFQDRASRFVEHCCGLIQAVQAKRSFPGLATLSMSKQQELHEKVLEHFEELKQNLKHVERIEREHRLSDVRSTVWVLYACCGVVLAILLTLFLLDLRMGLLTSLLQQIELAIEHGDDWLSRHIPFL